jgi:hypothetical protein
MVSPILFPSPLVGRADEIGWTSSLLGPSFASHTSLETRRISKIKKDLRFIRARPETKRVSTSAPPDLEFVLLEWPTFLQPLDFGNLIECAKSEHLSSCGGRFYYGLVHSKDRLDHLQPDLECVPCRARDAVEGEVMTYLRTTQLSGGHLNEYYDYWNWDREFTLARIIPEDRKLVDCAANFVRRCIEIMYEELGLSFHHMMKVPKAAGSKGKKRR